MYFFMFSLIDVLADRLHAPMLSGMVLVNCKHKPSNFRSLVGYVVQVSFFSYLARSPFFSVPGGDIFSAQWVLQ